MYLRRVVRARVPEHCERALRPLEEAGFEFDLHFYLTEPPPVNQDTASSAVYGRARYEARDILVRIEEVEEGHQTPHVDTVDLGEGAVGRSPVFAVLLQAIYGDKFEPSET